MEELAVLIDHQVVQVAVTDAKEVGGNAVCSTCLDKRVLLLLKHSWISIRVICQVHFYAFSLRAIELLLNAPNRH